MLVDQGTGTNEEVCSSFGRAEVVQPPRPCLTASYTEHLMYVAFSRTERRVPGYSWKMTLSPSRQFKSGTDVWKMSPSILVVSYRVSNILVLHGRVIPPKRSVSV